MLSLSSSTRASARRLFQSRHTISLSPLSSISLSTTSSSISRITPTPKFFSSATTPSPPIESNKVRSEFKAETRQLLDIVTNSIYTDKEVFLRELISNASDSCEKLRHLQSINSAKVINECKDDLGIWVDVDEKNGEISIRDNGVGLTKDEMTLNLGTIARSGSSSFVEEQVGGKMEDIIGKFGVGFYSSFMVGESVSVISKSAYEVHDDASLGSKWTSDGGGEFDVMDSEVSEVTDLKRGAKIVIKLKESEKVNYGTIKKVESVIKKYSNFVSFPITLNGERINTMEAVWSIEPNKVSEETHSAFYKFLANAWDEPLYKLHYRADAPIEFKALFYIPSYHTEKYNMGRMDPGVSLYSRKVLIEAKHQGILPDWLRFVKGVVDSEDLPLSISREKSQDTKLIEKLKITLTRRLISEFTKLAKKDPETYKTKFFPEFGHFLKEGVCQDYMFQSQLSKLLYFESNKTKTGELTSLDEYVSRSPPDQKDIYYLCAPTRQLALSSPYYEAFDKSGKEVLFVYSAIDDFVMSNLGTFEERKLITAEKDGLNLDSEKENEDGDADKKDDEDKKEDKKDSLTVDEQQALCAWLEVTLGSKVQKVNITKRLASSPAVVTDHESGALRRMMRMVDTQGGSSTAPQALPKQTLEINAKHPIMRELFKMKASNETIAVIVAEQVFDNALVAAGILDDGRVMLPRLNEILERVLGVKK